MPELPEVETIKNELTPHVLGRDIEDITLLWEGIVKQLPAGEFRSRVIGQRIIKLARRGKYLLFGLSGGETLVMHMKMTGSLLVNSDDDRFTRAVIHLGDGTRLYFRDPRKFGAMWLTADDNAVADKLGPEPLEEGFTVGTLIKLLLGRTAPIKAVLIDQAVIAGIGNMYADEALFEAKIHPERPAGSLNRDEVERLYRAIGRVLRSAIGNKGASVRNYLRPGGELGTAHYEFRVAHGLGKSCPDCGTPIQRITVRNRGTYYCPKCQKLKSAPVR
ncbi:MAG: DNA-formamidopyrimidine glycosylase [Chloroflexi bacterium RBG_16_50_9]|nr:MAG: DNA-formamidopyrimidine glycosylase [Chloroflexi bacterium RBG_16_50_9]